MSPQKEKCNEVRNGKTTPRGKTGDSHLKIPAKYVLV